MDTDYGVSFAGEQTVSEILWRIGDQESRTEPIGNFLNGVRAPSITFSVQFLLIVNDRSINSLNRDRNRD
ncbi:Uncharacterized protein APZ42_026754 [Daphnia magna]|uniref:Uncharacterized protein n=1 Tax=Daphnia magna TaxID=35525 RepID=A0A0P6HYN9_9CRUS|nr:Uncharacterized protein APZ42_026754 [Daphnia magna]